MTERQVNTQDFATLDDEVSVGPSPWQRQLSTRLPWLTPKTALIAFWAVALAGFSYYRGVPVDRFQQNLWILSGLLLIGLGNPKRSAWRLLLDWLPFILFLYLYDFSRGAAEKLGMPTHVTEAIDFDKFLFFGNIPTVWLQQHLYDPTSIPWWEVVTSLCYFSHFVAVWVIAAVLYATNRDRWVKFARRVLVLSFAGLITFALFPAAPPWWASVHGYIDVPVPRLASRGWDVIGLHMAGQLIQAGQGVVNDVAAIPSLHTGFAVLISVFFWRSVPRWGKVLLFLYPVLMAFTLVYAGEHFVIDTIIGAIYVAGTFLGCNAWERWREKSKTANAARTAAVPDPVIERDATTAPDPAG
jgi:hypothetical protein